MRHRVNDAANQAKRAYAEYRGTLSASKAAIAEGHTPLGPKLRRRAGRLKRAAQEIARHAETVAASVDFPNLVALAKADTTQPNEERQHKGPGKRAWRRKNPGQAHKAPWVPKNDGS
ncbi:MAG: hypothetical protein EBQ89_09445 [Alphaproteobacteria bacterium]|nr:hypothetical protein [Alphaproteobacteria bacterium]